jgi:hypothetical protein
MDVDINPEINNKAKTSGPRIVEIPPFWIGRNRPGGPERTSAGGSPTSG